MIATKTKWSKKHPQKLFTEASQINGVDSKEVLQNNVCSTTVTRNKRSFHQTPKLFSKKQNFPI